jgi:thiol-disulfide isomerase/thioredoxin
MSRPVAVGAGLIAGALVAVLVVGSIIALAPPPTVAEPSPTASPSSEPSPPAASATPVESPASSASPTPSATIVVSGFHIGEEAPPLVLPQLNGGEIDLAKLRGKGVWLNFMATWCPPCQDEFPIMNGYAARYSHDGLVVVAVDVRESEEAVAAFAESLNVIFPMALDGAGEAQEAWGAYALPMHFWIDAEGIVRDGAFGGIGPDIMAEGLRAILPDVEIET